MTFFLRYLLLPAARWIGHAGLVCTALGLIIWATMRYPWLVFGTIALAVSLLLLTLYVGRQWDKYTADQLQMSSRLYWEFRNGEWEQQ